MSHVVRKSEDGTITVPANAVKMVPDTGTYTVSRQGWDLVVSPRFTNERKAHRKLSRGKWMQEWMRLVEELSQSSDPSLSALDELSNMRR
jgi:hypothetical protein